jgi:Glycosyl transferases group 1
MRILFLCREWDLQREPLAYVRAFRRVGIECGFVQNDCRLNESIGQLMDCSQSRPSLIIQPESDFPLFPWGLDKVNVPTACFHFDPYAYLHRRVRWAMLFDYAVIFHPGFEGAFQRAGHPNPVTIPHAVDAEFFAFPAIDRSLEIGWIGRSGRSHFKRRRRVLEMLALKFRMNDWGRMHSYEELARVYCTSKLVVNIGRDDYPIDVSLRFAEAMAGGALFITMLPSEMNVLGFQDGIHFVGVQFEDEICEVARYYLDHETERRRIAEAGREKVLREHTYDCRVKQLMGVVERNKGELFAPVRRWPEDRVRLVHLDFYVGNGRFDYAKDELAHIARVNLRTAASGGAILARGLASKARSRLSSLLRQK